jgi:hypothetical protein
MLNQRRFKACAQCREQKLRCKRNDERPEDGCERCIEAGRQCIVRERVKKTNAGVARNRVSSVAQLESKLDALIAALAERTDSEPEGKASNNSGHSQSGKTNSSSRGNWLDSPLEPLHIREYPQSSHNDPVNSICTIDDTAESSPAAARKYHRTARMAANADHHFSYSYFLPKPHVTSQVVQNDIISRSLISQEEAELVFSQFIDVMLPHFPAIVFPPDSTVSTLRSTKPALLLAILGAASSVLGESIQEEIMAEVMKMFADRIVIRGDKDLDLVQALHVSALWYFPPKHFNEVKIYQFIQMAAIMAIELGFAQPTRSGSSRLPMMKNAGLNQLLKGNAAMEASKRDEQRALLACYILCGMYVSSA